MNFFAHEIRKLKDAFPNKTASMETDFEEFELDAINNLGVLKHQAHLYLGTRLLLVVINNYNI